jgi:hypothetical protein
MKQARLINAAESKALAGRLSTSGNQFVRNSESFAKELKARSDAFKKRFK